MSTFGPVSIRPGEDDILFSRKEEELLLMLDRNSEMGKGARISSSRGPSVVAVGGGNRGAEIRGVSRNSGAGRDDGSGAWAGAGGNGGGGGGGGRLSGGIRGSAGSGRSPPAALGNKKPNVPPPAYSSLNRLREGATGGATRPGQVRGSRSNGRRLEDSHVASEGPASRPGLSVGHALGARNRGTRLVCWLVGWAVFFSLLVVLV